MIEHIINEIRRICEEKRFKNILIQIPEGLRIYIKEIQEGLRDLNVFFSLDSCYGACDVYKEFDATFHIAHTKIFDMKNVYFLDYFQDVRTIGSLLESLDMLPKNIGIVTTAQFGYFMNELKRILEYFGKNVFIERGRLSKFPGQIFGCYFEPARRIEKYVDCFLYFGTGKFHPIGLSLVTKKDVYAFDPIIDEFSCLKDERERFIKRRYLEISRAKNTDMKKIGIIISKKIGQKRIGLALELKKHVIKMGSKPYLLYMDEVSPEKLLGLDIDFYINTACPRIIDDYEKFKDFIILNPNEFFILLGKKNDYILEDYF